jgi:hypothetical protein
MKWKAGAAAVRFTPWEPMWLAGYAVRTEPSRGVLSDLWASALALEDAAGDRLIVVSADIIAIPRELADRAAAQVREKHAIPRDHFVFAATHTHYGPEVRPDKAPFFKIPPDYAALIPQAADLLIGAMSFAAEQALRNLSPARLLAGRTTAHFAHNRRTHSSLNTHHSSLFTDHDVPVLTARSPDGTIRAVIFGYACHNLTIDPHDRRFSADWAGFARAHIRDWNGGAISLFIPGCGADQDPQPRGSVELSQQHGRTLAQAVQQCVAGSCTEIEPSLAVAAADVPLEMQPVTTQWIEESLASGDPPRQFKAEFLRQHLAGGGQLKTRYDARVQVVRLGRQVLLIALGGEPVAEWAHRFRQEFGVDGGSTKSAPPLVWVAGYCNDMCGYIPTRRIQQEGGYEAGRATLWSALPAPWTETVEDRIADAVRRLVEQVRW